MNAEVRENLLTSMRGEAFAYAKYLLFARHAQRLGKLELARLFEKTAETELFEHFAEEAELAGLVGDDVDNLRDAMGGESYEIETMYREFAAHARAIGDTAAAERFDEVRRDEMKHREAFQMELGRIVMEGELAGSTPIA